MSALSRGLAPRMSPLSARRSTIVAALDIGTSKVICAIGRLRPFRGDEARRGRSHSIDVLGFGHARASGLKGGAIIDLASAEESVRQAVSMAERAAGVEVASVVLSVGGGRLGGESFSASVQLNGPSIEQHDISRVLDAASLHSIRDGRAVLHSLPVNFALDGNRGIREPRGMLGQDLGVDLHVVTADLPALRNLILCVERCHLTVEGVIAAPYAAGLAVLSQDEIELGATVIDCGAGTTTLAAFVGGHCVHVDGIALGCKPHHDGPRARSFDPLVRCRAPEDAAWQRHWHELRSSRHDYGAAHGWQRLGIAGRGLALASRQRHSAARRGNSGIAA